MMNSVEVIFFDAVGTLFDVKGSVGSIYSQAAQPFGIQLDPLTLNRAFYAAFQDSPPAAFPGADPVRLPDLERAWWQDVVERTFAAMGHNPRTAQFPGFEDFFRQVFDVFTSADTWTVFPETHSVLTGLQQQGFRLAVISNFDSRLYPVLDVLGLTPYFSSITISTRVGAAKPHPKVFEVALQQESVDPALALHVGDSYSQDFEGARQAGLQALWVNRSSSRPDLSEVLQIPNLSPLLSRVPSPSSQPLKVLSATLG